MDMDKVKQEENTQKLKVSSATKQVEAEIATGMSSVRSNSSKNKDTTQYTKLKS